MFVSFLFNIARDRLGKTNQHCDTKILRLLQKPVWFQLLQNVGILSTMTTLKPGAQNDRFVFPLLEKNTCYVIIGKQIFCICRKQGCKGGGGGVCSIGKFIVYKILVIHTVTKLQYSF